ncbi:MAG: DotU family type IV/VI secretion system protein [Bilophila sp.]
MLRDCFTPCFLLMLRLPDVSATKRTDLRTEAVQRLEAAASLARRRCDPATVEIARCLVEAWMDETALKLTWEGRMAWLRDPLQRRWQKGRHGGDWFFATTRRLVPCNAEDVALAGVALRCLGFGFQGNLYASPERLRLEHHSLAKLFGYTAVPHDFPPRLSLSGNAHLRYMGPLLTGILAALLLTGWITGNQALSTKYAEHFDSAPRLLSAPSVSEEQRTPTTGNGYGAWRGRLQWDEPPQGEPR